jgi:hypothetical protein
MFLYSLLIHLKEAFVWSLLVSLIYVAESWNLKYAVEVDLNDRGMDVVRVDHEEVMYYQNQKNPT